MKSIVLAITGASGAIYGRALLAALTRMGRPLELVVSDAGRRVAREELGFAFDSSELNKFLGKTPGRWELHSNKDIGANIASGSYPVHGMVVAPCSMGTAGRIAAGISSSLIERAADVQLKERRPLVLVIRETPLSTLHLENLLKLSQLGATIVPASPGFYMRPQAISALVRFVVERVLQELRLEFDQSVVWRGGDDK